MASVSWTSATSGDWTVASNWSTGNEPGTGDDASISVAGSYTVSLTAAVSVDSITIGDAGASLQIQDPGGDDVVTGNLASSGSVGIDTLGAGGSTLTVGGTLTNGNFLQVGNAGMTAAALLTVGGTLQNTAATLTLQGGQTGGAAQLTVTGEAPGTLTGTYNVDANIGGASLQWGSGGITQIGDGASNGGDLAINGADAFVEVGATNSNGALDTLTTIAGNGLLDLRNGVTVITADGLTVDGGDSRLKIDAYGGSGGGGVTIGGDLTNGSAGNFGDGGVSVGNGNMTVSDTLTVDGTVSNTGIVDVTGGQTGAAARMLVTGAAPGTLTGTYNVVGDQGGAVLQFGSGGITQIGDGASLGGDLYIDGSNAFVEIGATNSNNALTGLATIAGNGLLDLRDGITVTAAGGLTVNGGDGRLKIDAYGGRGGSEVTIDGDLTNGSAGNFGDGGVSVGNSNMTVSDTLTVDGIVSNAGIVDVTGGQTGAAAQMLVTGAAPGTLTGTYNIVGDTGGAALQFGSGGITQIGDGASLGGDLYIDGSDAFAEIGATNSNSALTGLATIAGNGLLDLRDSVAITISGGLTVDGGDGRLKVDAYGGSGGGDVSIGGDLTNSSAGNFGDGGVAVGNSNMTVSDTLTVDGIVSNTGIVDVTGGRTGAAGQMLVTGAAPGTLTGTYNIVGDTGGAALQFGSGGITQIGDGASLGGDLYIDGSNAFAEIGATDSNSALTTLTTIAGNGLLDLRDGDTVTTSASLTIDGGDGRLKVDAYGGAGGSDVTIGGDLTNSSFGNFSDGGVSVGNGNMSTSATLAVDGSFNNTGGLLTLTGGRAGAAAQMTVTGAAPATLTGQYNIVGEAGGAALQWGSGGIAQIGDGAGNSGDLYIDGSNAFAEIGASNSNSALDTLTTIAGNGLLDLRDGTTVTTAGGLTVDGGDGRLKVDAYGSSGGGSDVTIGGDLTNSSFGNFSDGGVSVGNGNMSTGATLAVDGEFDNTGGLLTLAGGRAGAAAQMTVASAAPATLTGQYDIVGDAGGASLQWGSGGITQIGDGAGNSSDLYIDGSNAFAEIGATNSNSALTGLATIAGNGLLDLRDGVMATTSGGLTVEGGDGRLKVDAYGNSAGGSDVIIGGDLANSSFGNFSDGGVSVGNGNMSTSATLAVDGSFNNTGGLLTLTGGRAGAAAQMTVTGAAPATLTGQYNIVGDAGGAALQWGSGGITQIGDGAGNGGYLYIDGSNAFAEIGATNSNGALDTLTTIAGNGVLDLRDGTTVTTAGGLTVDGGDGRLKVDAYGNSAGGSDVTIGGDLVNGSPGNFSDGGIAVGNPEMINSDLLTVSGTLVNNAGAIVTIDGNASDGGAGQAVTTAKAVTNSGAVNILANAVLEIAAGNTYTQNGGNTFVSGTLVAGSVALNGGVINLSTGHLDAAALSIAAGSSLIGFGTVAATITSAGSIEASGGSLDLAGGLAATAAIAIENASALELAGADSGGVTFAGSSGIFVLDDPIGFTGTISGLGVGDTLVLRNTQATGAVATYDAGSNTSTLAISLSGGGTLDFTLAGNYAGEAFGTNPVGNDTQIAAAGAAVGAINTPLPVAIGAIRQGAPASVPLSITNNAPTGSAALDVSIGALTGGATASGTITALAPGATDASDITVGIGNGAAGVQTGTVTLDFASDLGGGNTALLPTEAVAVSGTVYREALASIAPLTLYAHVGDPGLETLSVSNIAPADGYSENLIATLTGATGGFGGTGTGATGDIAPGASDAVSLALDFSTAQAGIVSGSAMVSLVSDGGTGAGSIDGLGTVALSNRAVPISVHIDNFATASIQAPTAYGTLTTNGSTETLDLGTIAHNSGPFDINFGVANTADGPADLLSGSLVATPASGFTLTGLGAFAGLGAGQADTSSVTLDTTGLGVVTQTVTLDPTDSNAGGYSAALAAQTLTVTGTLAVLPPPTITVAPTLAAMTAVPALLGLSIGDPNLDTRPLTVTVSDTNGALIAQTSGSATVSGNGTNLLTLTGNIADLNHELETLSYTAAAVGTDTIDIDVLDEHHAAASQTVAVGVSPVPFTLPVFNSPANEMVVVGSSSGYGGLSVSDPSAEATGQPITVVFASQVGTLNVTGDYGGTVLGQGTGTLAITGTVPQINAYLGDGLLEDIGEALVENAFDFTVDKTVGFIKTGTIDLLPSQEDIVKLGGGPEGKFFELGVVSAVFALDSLIGLIPGNEAPSRQEFINALVEIIGDPHIIAPDGAIYDFNAEGEFILAAATQPGDSFDVQVRLQSFDNSSYASVVTQVGAQVGTDRVTFATGRADTIEVDGTAAVIGTSGSIALSGGVVTEVADNSYRVSWNTGEVLNVTAAGNFLDVSIAPGPNNGVGSLVGLATLADTPADQFQLVDGSILQSPLSSQTLYGAFADAWRVPQADSLLDYAPGQTTATFTNNNFPVSDITLADLPADVVAQAASVVAAAGITDPGAAAAVEFDYIVSGGDASIVAADASYLSGVTTTSEQATPIGPAPVAIGVIADQAQEAGSNSGTTAVAFKVYLTAPSATDEVITYAAVASALGDLGAAAFGGALPTGQVTIAAGQISSKFTIDIPPGALGLNPDSILAVNVSATDGTPIFAPTAQTTIVQAIPGPPAIPVIADLTNLGSFTVSQNGLSYTLDLGQVQYGEPVPSIQFAIENAATAPSDALNGTFNVAPVEGFTVTGATLPAPLGGGASYQGLNVAINSVKFGANSETITFSPTDSNVTGYSAALPPVTLTIEDTIVAPTMVFSQAWGDVHIVTYNGLTYNFQGEGEFILAHSRVPGDSFDIQMRLQPWGTGSSVTVISQVAVSVGTETVTFDQTRADTVYVDGNPSTIDQANPLVNLDGGTLTQIDNSTWQVKWDTGEEATITGWGKFFNITDGIPLSEPDMVGGLQGEDAGATNDFQLSDGTVLQQPLTSNELYGEFADSWRVTQASSLFDYLPGQTTATFTDPNFPADLVTLSDLPSNLVTAAAQVVANAGISDPGIAAQTELDYIATGDPAFIAAAQQISTQVTNTTPITPQPSTPPVAAVGVEANPVGYTQAASGPTHLTFDAYLTAHSASDTVVDYAVVAPGAGFVDAATFGGTLPSGSVTIAAGATLQAFTIDLPQGALGTLPSDELEVQITAPGGTPVFAPQAVASIANNTVQAGTPPIPQLLDLSHVGTLTENSPTAYTLDLGTLSQGQASSQIQLAIANEAAPPADALSGTFGAPMGTGFLVIGNSLPGAIVAGQQYDGLYVAPQTSSAGQNTETLVFKASDVNASGYVAPLAPITLTITDTVTPPGVGQLNTPQTIVFPNVHVGTPESQDLNVSNTGSAPIAVSVSAAAPIIAQGTIASLAPGATDTTDLSVGVDTSSAGAKSSAVDVNFGSTDPIVDTFGDVFRLASGTVAAVTDFVHVGDPGTIAIDISNGATADGFSENLLGTLVAVTPDSGTFGIAAAGPTAEIAAGSSNATSLLLDFSTAHTGTITGTATVGLTSDGGIGADSIDGLGTTALASLTTPVTITVDGFANPVFEDVSALGTFAQNGTAYTLDLGAIQQNSAPLAVDLGVLNDVTGPADVASGSLTVSGSSAFTNSGLAPFTDLAAGQRDIAPMVTLATGTTGTFSETITLAATGSNAGGFSGVLPNQTLTVSGTIVPASGGSGSPGPATLSGTLANIGVVADTPLTPASGLTVTDTGEGDTDTVTITLDNPEFGAVTNLGGGSYASGVYSVAGAPGAVTTAIDGLLITPAAPAPDVYLTSTAVAVSLVGSAGGSATQSAIDASVQQVLGLASVPVGDVAISVSGDGTGLAAPVGGDTNEAAVTNPTTGAVYTLPTGYKAEYLGGSANANLLDTDVGGAVLVGNTGNDVLVAGAANDSIVAGDGNNTLQGGSGAVALVVGNGNDSITTVADSTYTVSLGGGTDTVFANGSGTVTGGTGSDLVDASGTGLSATDLITLRGLHDSVLGGAGGLTVLDQGVRDTIQGGSGATTVTLDGLLDRARGGAGSFGVFDQTANNTVIGGTAGLTAVTISAAAASTTMYGRAASTSILDLASNAVIGAGGGTGAVTVGGPNAQVYGGFGGTGTLNVTIGAANALVSIDNANTTIDGSSSLASGLLVIGGFLNSAAADGTLSILGGADSLIAVTGGSNSTIDAGSAFTGVYIGTGSVGSGSIGGSNLIEGGSGPLQISFIGGAGTATVYGGEGQTSVYGTAGTYVQYQGSGGAALLFANGTDASTETLNAAGSTTNDTLYAAHGNVSLVAGGGNDLLIAGDNTGSLGGAGSVVGGATLLGGAGHDLFDFSSALADGADVIANYTPQDTVVLADYDTLAGGAAGSGTQASLALQHAMEAGGNTTIALADGTTITFLDTTTAQLQGHVLST